MTRASPAGILFIAVLLQAVAAVLCNFPASMTLERAFPTNHHVLPSQLKARDRLRHGRLLESSNAVINFPVEGTYNPNLVGLYHTKVKLGSPPREFHVQIDTGSNVLWVSCSSCKTCPKSTDLKFQLNSFDPGNSSTASLMSCSDPRCESSDLTSEFICSAANNQCTYSFQYADESSTSGIYLSDLMYFDTFSGKDTVNTNSSAQVVFGCSTSAAGTLTKSDSAVDGIFGFGPQNISVISQLSSQGIAPNVFSHCLKGDDTGGGILVLGKIDDPNLVYTPLIPSKPHYNINLLNITVNDKIVPNISEFFTTSTDQGTIVDSGTTLAYITETAYYPFITAVKSVIPLSVTPISTPDGFECYTGIKSFDNVFPQVGFHFDGGGSMVLEPKEYLFQQKFTNGVDTIEGWCIGFQMIEGLDITILGDLVLKDKLVVYDLDSQRIGWTNYDCSKSVNVITKTGNGTKIVTIGSQTQSTSGSSSFRNEPLIPIYLYISILFVGSFLLI
ncbi:hypothetical protein UlMin_007486 [Ulmus minor]